MLLYHLTILMGALGQFAIHSPPADEPKTWEFCSVVFATVVAYEDLHFAGRVKLVPLATLSGNLDSALEGEVTAGAEIGNLETTDILTAPRVGTKVIVFLARDINGNYRIPNGGASFFPKSDIGANPCICEVTGFDDPKVTETIENLRKLRGKQREEAEQKAAAKKKSADKNIPPPSSPAK